jgi:hypothetical protein
MSDTTSLEELFRQAVTFPGAGVAVSRLQVALSHLEEEIERAADQITVRLRAGHARLKDKLHPEDKEYEEYDLDHTVNVLLPKIIRGGFLLTMWSVFEVAARDLAEYAYREKGLPRDKGDPFRYGDLLDNIENVFTRDLGVPAFPDLLIRERIDELRKFRHVLIHHDGKVLELPPSLRRNTEHDYSAIGLHFYEDMRHQYVVPKAEFVRAALDLVSEYLLKLSERVYHAVHPTPLKDDA